MNWIKIPLALFILWGGQGIWGQSNPFLAPGQLKPRPPAVVQPAPPPPKPIPRNPNLEFRGYYKFQDKWKFAIFDKSKNEGVWLEQNEVSHDGTTSIESFNLEKEEVILTGGISLSLKKSDGKPIPIAVSSPKPKAEEIKNKLPAQQRLPLPKKASSQRTR